MKNNKKYTITHCLPARSPALSPSHIHAHTPKKSKVENSVFYCSSRCNSAPMVTIPLAYFTGDAQRTKASWSRWAEYLRSTV